LAGLPAEREQQILAQLDTLTKEMQSLRAELAAAQARNQELQKAQVFAQQSAASTPSYAWLFAGAATLALGFGLLLAWRSRKPADGGWEENSAVGPATRLGVHPEHERSTRFVPESSPVQTTQRVAAPDEASTAAIAGAWAAASPPEPAAARGGVPTVLDAHSTPDDGAIEVTEFAHTGQGIQDLYTPFLATIPGGPTASRPSTPSGEAPLPVPPIPEAPQPLAGVFAAAPGAARGASSRPHLVDVNLDAITEVLANQKTQIAVDLDVGTQVPLTQVLGDWDPTLFQPPRDESPTPAAPAVPLTPLDFELKFDATEAPARRKS
jgi:hypothetical protein